MLLVLAIGLALRLVYAALTPFNPDEALHYLHSYQPSLADAYRASLQTAHPPLFFVALSLWTRLGNGELFLRLLPIGFGVAALAFGHGWLARFVSPAAAFFALCLLAVHPVAIALTTELRQYAMLLCFEFLALYLLERAFRLGSPAALAGSAVALTLAIATHYSAVCIFGAVAVAVLAELTGVLPPLRTVARDRASRVGGLRMASSGFAIPVLACGWFYASHLAVLQRSEMRKEAMRGWLSDFFHRDGFLEIPRTIADGLIGVLRHIAGSRLLIVAAAMALVVGWIQVARIRRAGTGGAGGSWLLLALPMVLGAAAGLAGVFPFGNTRHCAYLLPFLVLGVAACAPARLGRWKAAAIASGLAVYVAIRLHPLWLYNDPRTHSHAAVAQAVRFLHWDIPPGATLLSDDQTHYLLHFHLAREQMGLAGEPAGPLELHRFGPHRVYHAPIWLFDERSLADTLLALRRDLGVEGPVWIPCIGWGYDGFWRELPAEARDQGRRFGPDVLVLQDASPAARTAASRP